MKQLQDSLSYGFFKKLARSFIHRLSPEELPTSQSRKQAEIAITFELTSRLNAMDSHPMNRVLGFGATYLQDYFTPWVNQQGGYVSTIQLLPSHAYSYSASFNLFDLDTYSCPYLWIFFFVSCFLFSGKSFQHRQWY